MVLNDFVRGKPKIAETVDLLVLRSTEIDSQLESNPETTLSLIPGTLKLIRVALHKLRNMGFKEAIIATDHGFFLNAHAEAGDVCLKPQGKWPINAHDRMMLGTGEGDVHSVVISAEKVESVAIFLRPRCPVAWRHTVRVICIPWRRISSRGSSTGSSCASACPWPARASQKWPSS